MLVPSEDLYFEAILNHIRLKVLSDMIQGLTNKRKHYNIPEVGSI